MADMLAPSSFVRTRPSWLWFVVGFVAVFVLLALFDTALSMHPSGRALVQCKLWQYCLNEIPHEFAVRRNIGPGDGLGSPFVVLFKHVLASGGGGVMYGLVWAVRKCIAKG